MKKRFILIVIVFLLFGCGNAMVERIATSEDMILITEGECEKYSGWGIYCKDNCKDKENRRVVFNAYLDAMISYMIKDKQNIDNNIGEYYLKENYYFDGGNIAYSGWHTFKEYEEKVNGYVKFIIKGYGYGSDGYSSERNVPFDLWIPTENIFYYRDLPRPSDKIRKKIEKDASPPPKQ